MKSKTIRVSTEVYEFLRKQIDPLNEKMDDVIKRMLPNPDTEIIHVVGAIVFQDMKSAQLMADTNGKEVQTYAKL